LPYRSPFAVKSILLYQFVLSDNSGHGLFIGYLIIVPTVWWFVKLAGEISISSACCFMTGENQCGASGEDFIGIALCYAGIIRARY
jgi:hypothetical protein